ncbi:BA75_03541T0 [Komagataella pastoris]|uniref:BA75_03541T0 n=1 Tax=Komagataella pastoris TaxID=4922 RepID=A0A1B2JGC5_PICPA|nr:BA75_03541T0 [Komagataella pastoris]
MGNSVSTKRSLPQRATKAATQIKPAKLAKPTKTPTKAPSSQKDSFVKLAENLVNKDNIKISTEQLPFNTNHEALTSLRARSKDAEAHRLEDEQRTHKTQKKDDQTNTTDMHEGGLTTITPSLLADLIRDWHALTNVSAEKRGILGDSSIHDLAYKHNVNERVLKEEIAPVLNIVTEPSLRIELPKNYGKLQEDKDNGHDFRVRDMNDEINKLRAAEEEERRAEQNRAKEAPSADLADVLNSTLESVLDNGENVRSTRIGGSGTAVGSTPRERHLRNHHEVKRRL